MPDESRPHLPFAILVAICAAVAAAAGGSLTNAQQAGQIQGQAQADGDLPKVSLVPAARLTLTGDVDSNSPAVWSLTGGRWFLHVLTSHGGEPSLESGRSLTMLGDADPVQFVSHPGNGVWMEAVVPDLGGTWYGYYHNEIPAAICNDPGRVMPRIGAMRSRDRGQTWEDLGIILEAFPGWHSCTTRNTYFVGGVGDLSVVLDPMRAYVYVFFSQYSRPREAQGVAVARMAWAERDNPRGRLTVWSDGVWLPPTTKLLNSEDPSAVGLIYPPGTSIVPPVSRPWHDSDVATDAFWGPSVHWNSYLQQYVMLLNRARDEAFKQEGIYVAFASSLATPSEWSTPSKILEGGAWYPQVLGTETGYGTDKAAGKQPRLFISGVSEYSLEFQRADGK